MYSSSSLGGGDARLSAVGEVRSGGHNPADTLCCVPALETVLIATGVLPGGARLLLLEFGDEVDSMRRGARVPWIAATFRSCYLLLESYSSCRLRVWISTNCIRSKLHS